MAAIFTHSLTPSILFLLVQFHLLILSTSFENKNPQYYSFNSLINLEGLSKGQTAKGLPYIKHYLKRFGYLNNYNQTALYDEYFDSVLESAIKLYQRNYNLKVTGELDFGTIKQVSSPRCGVSDIGLRYHHHDHTHVVLNDSMININYAFANGTPKWPPSKSHLTYTFNSGVQPVSLEDLSSVTSQAFAEWTKNSKFTFEEVRAGVKSDLTLGFFVGDHGDGLPFDGPNNILAHAFFPPDGRLHFDGAENWNVGPPDNSSQYELLWVALHEIGHLLGLDHSSDPNAVMYALVTVGASRRALSPDDIAGIQALYSTP